MCMKYINANVSFFESISIENNIVAKMERSFDTILATSNEKGEYIVSDFSLFTSLNVIGTNNPDEQKNHVLHQKGTLKVILRLTKCSTDVSKQLGADVDSFEFDFSKITPDMACYPFYCFTRVTHMNGINVPELGAYVVKVLVKDDFTDDYTIQSMRRLIITDKISS